MDQLIAIHLAPLITSFLSIFAIGTTNQNPAPGQDCNARSFETIHNLDLALINAYIGFNELLSLIGRSSRASVFIRLGRASQLIVYNCVS